MKKVILFVLGTILVIISAALVLYPFISNYLMGLNQQAEIDAFENAMANTDSEVISRAIEDAREYNRSLYGHVVLTDPFDPGFSPVFDKEYSSLLNIKGDGVMGYVDIPKIDVMLPIYHGTADEELRRGAGHLQNTSLPVGGKGTHSVLTGHTGLSTARLFTDLNQMENGDIFMIHVLDQTLAYQVDQIVVVEPSETDELKINPNEDYVTLITCTPYGINSHRLFVRGTRIPYTPETEEMVQQIDRTVESTWMAEYRKAVIAGFILLVILIILIIIVRLILKRRKKRKALISHADVEKDTITDLTDKN